MLGIHRLRVQLDQEAEHFTDAQLGDRLGLLQHGADASLLAGLVRGGTEQLHLAVGAGSRPNSRFSVVDLPAPLGPRMATVWPRGILRSMPRTAPTGPKDLVSAVSATAGVSSLVTSTTVRGMVVTLLSPAAMQRAGCLDCRCGTQDHLGMESFEGDIS